MQDFFKFIFSPEVFEGFKWVITGMVAPTLLWLLKQLSTAIKTANEAKQSTKELKDSQDKSDLDSAALRSELELVKRELESVRSNHAILTSNYLSALKLIDEFQAEREDLRTHIKGLEARIQELEKKLSAESDSNVALKLENEALKAELLRCHAEIDAIKTEHNLD